ncbi:MAG: type II toxin-antitoxin system VapC family toxin [Fimbriiglobus sp.]|jgi:PIN domain nuclease of toxin-antitoxin system|nr:type II toxin-antitoxin system VapC family toxin [Fimbriiglobus sp.]
MTLLLDTCTVLWFWWADPRLSAAALALMTDPANRKLVSRATPWEVAIKVSQKKLDIGGPYRGFFPEQMHRNNFEWLETTDDHLAALVALPFHHKDPFDRLIIAQASWEGIPIVTSDAAFDPYPVRRLW